MMNGMFCPIEGCRAFALSGRIPDHLSYPVRCPGLVGRWPFFNFAACKKSPTYLLKYLTFNIRKIDQLFLTFVVERKD